MSMSALSLLSSIFFDACLVLIDGQDVAVDLAVPVLAQFSASRVRFEVVNFPAVELLCTHSVVLIPEFQQVS